MTPYSHSHKSVTVTVHEVEVTCTGVIFYPCAEATETDPPDPAFVEYDGVFIGGVEVKNLFIKELADELEDALIGELEAA